MKAFLWSGTDVVSGGKCAVAWPLVQPPLHLGGLGVLDLCLFGDALRLRWLWSQRTNTLMAPERNLPAGIAPQLKEFFDRSVIIQVGSGKAVFFWTDKWLHNRSIAEPAAHLVASVPMRFRRSRTVEQALHNNQWRHDTKSPLTRPSRPMRLSRPNMPTIFC